ncbi:hypothetical protein RB195_005258 [Necator americanus]
MVLFIAWLVVAKSYYDAKPTFKRWGRIGRIIANVDEYSKILSREVIASDERFLNFTNLLAKRDRPPYLLYIDEGYFDVTLNHLCNLEYMRGSTQRLAVVSFDPEMEKKLNTLRPSIPTVTLDFSVVKKSLPKNLENRSYVIYQLVLMLRSHIASILSSRGISFWSMQQDSIWTENFVSMNVEQHYPNSLLIFDTVGNDQFSKYDRLMHGWICGSTFFVRASPVTVEFFKKRCEVNWTGERTKKKHCKRTSYRLIQCQGGTNDDSSTVSGFIDYDLPVRCTTLPVRQNASMVRSIGLFTLSWLVSSSNFFMGNRNVTPVVIQVDHKSELSKMELFRKEGFVFINDDHTCNATAVIRIKETVTVALDEVRANPTEQDEVSFFTHILWCLHRWIGLDPYYNRRFLRVHEGIV